MFTSETNEAVKIASALRPTVDEWERESTRSCIRAKKLTVVTAYDSLTQTIGVREAFSPDTMDVPCMPDLATVSVGDPVWVVWMYGDKSTMVAMWKGNIVTPASPDPNLYHAGDVLSSGELMCFGHLTSDKKDICITVPTVKSTRDVSLIASNITTLTIGLRIPSGGYIKNSGTYNVLTDNTVTVKPSCTQGGIFFRLSSTSDWHGTNNIPLNGTISLTCTFS